MVSRDWDGTSLDARVDDRRTAVGYPGAETPAANTPCGQLALERNRDLAGGRVLLEADAAYEFDTIWPTSLLRLYDGRRLDRRDPDPRGAGAGGTDRRESWC